MRRVLLIAGAAVLFGCPPAPVDKPPPPGRFYYPTGIVHIDSPFRLADGGVSEGVLYVASSNTDKRYDFSAVTAVDLNRVGLPGFGAVNGGGAARQLTLLGTDPGAVVQLASFAGEMAALVRDGGVRLYLPTRSEEHRLYALEAPTPASASEAPRLGCFQPSPTGAAAIGQDCTPTGMSLVAAERTTSGIPRAPAPIGIAISPPPGREVWVTALQQADTPARSTLDWRAYVVHVNGDNPVVDESSFVNVGAGATNSVVVGARHAYATGRPYANAVPAHLVRTIDTTRFTTAAMSLENTFTAFEGRGTALASDESRLYVVGRFPNTLIVGSVTNRGNPAPDVRVVRAVPLPEGPALVTTIARPGRSDLVVITCSDASVVAFYDDEVGNLVAQIEGVGLLPYALAVDTRPSPMGDPAGGARLYVTSFGSGQVAVIDVPELTRPSSARIVAFLGASQLCLTRGASDRTSCDGGTP